LDRARQGDFIEGERCRASPKQGWKLELGSLPKSLCAAKRPLPGVGEFWFATAQSAKEKADGRALTAVVRVAPAATGAADRCRLRLSAALFDDQGKTRLRFHADYGEALEVELLADACAVEFVFEASAQAFRARPAKGTRCPPP
jgi:hypothetical protein